MKNITLFKFFLTCCILLWTASNAKADINELFIFRDSITGLYGIRDVFGNIVTPAQFESIGYKFNGFAKIQQNGKYGFLNRHGEITIPPKFDLVAYFSEGLASVYKEYEGWSYIDTSGNVVISLNLNNGYASSFNYGIAEITVRNGFRAKKGFINKSGKMVISPQFDMAERFKEGLMAVRKDGKWGFIDTTGAIVISPQFDYASSFSEGMARIELKDKYGFIDKSGNCIIAPKFYWAYEFHEGLAEVKIKRKGKYGFINKSGELVIPAEFDDVEEFYDGLAKVEIDGKQGFIDYSGEFIVPANYEEAYEFQENLALVKLDGKYGFVDKSGLLKIPPKFDNGTDFYEGMAAVEINGKWGFIDNSGELVVPAKFDDVYSFYETSDGCLAKVVENNQVGIIDKSGKFIIPAIFEDVDIFRFSDGLAVVQKNGKWGFADIHGNWYEHKGQCYSWYVENIIKDTLGKWQQKGRYEKTQDYHRRVNEVSQQQFVDSLSVACQSSFLDKNIHALGEHPFNQTIAGYDADNEVFLIYDTRFGKLLVPVPIAEAPLFEQNFENLRKQGDWGIVNNKFTLIALTYITDDGKSYRYDINAKLNYLYQ